LQIQAFNSLKSGENDQVITKLTPSVAEGTFMRDWPGKNIFQAK
jgi:hypothetical protein